MHVQPFVPLRTSVIAPPAPTVTTDALCAIDAGAADSALATGSLEAVDAVELFAVAALSVFSEAFPVAAGLVHALNARSAAPAPNQTQSFDDVIDPSFRSEGRGA
jgi:hypothetical protein